MVFDVSFDPLALLWNTVQLICMMKQIQDDSMTEGLICLILST
jgi:hypothetical protein